MTPTNPAAPPAGSAQVTPSAMAIVRKYGIDCVDHDSYEAREREAEQAIEAYADARVDAATRELRQALEMLRDHQNGPPLPSYEDGWNKAMKMADAALERTEPR